MSVAATRPASPWLVSARWDVAVFGGPALAALALLAWGHATGDLGGDAPPWLFLVAVVFVDVAHVWATAYRVYLDPEARAARPGLAAGVPIGAYAALAAAHAVSPELFWRLLAYVAVIHFVRQQYGFMALYRRREGHGTRLDRVLDDAAIYGATLYPLLHWHASLPREFAWFVQGDFIPGLPRGAADALLPLHVGILAAWLLRQLALAARGVASPGKALLLGTTWACWFGGIVVLDSDYAFTVTNVLIHGIPYLALVWVVERDRPRPPGGWASRVFRPRRAALYLAPLLAVAFAEEWLWDRAVWHEHGMLFPGPDVWPSGAVLGVLVPLLALPQATHYLLDAWIWRVRPSNPRFASWLARPASP